MTPFLTDAQAVEAAKVHNKRIKMARELGWDDETIAGADAHLAQYLRAIAPIIATQVGGEHFPDLLDGLWEDTLKMGAEPDALSFYRHIGTMKDGNGVRCVDAWRKLAATSRFGDSLKES